MDKNPTSSFKNGGILGKKCSANLLKLRSKLVYREVIHDISAKKNNFFFKNKNPTSSFKIGGRRKKKKDERKKKEK